jgi:hypothetical protein
LREHLGGSFPTCITKDHWSNSKTNNCIIFKLTDSLENRDDRVNQLLVLTTCNIFEDQVLGKHCAEFLHFLSTHKLCQCALLKSLKLINNCLISVCYHHLYFFEWMSRLLLQLLNFFHWHITTINSCWNVPFKLLSLQWWLFDFVTSSSSNLRV